MEEDTRTAVPSDQKIAEGQYVLNGSHNEIDSVPPQETAKVGGQN